MFKSILVVLSLIFAIINAQLSKDCLHDCDDKPYGYKIPDSSDCMGYFLCHGAMIMQQYCAPGTKFDAIHQTCAVGKCPPCNCKDTTTTPTLPTPTTPCNCKNSKAGCNCSTSTTPGNNTTPCGGSPPPNCSTLENGTRLPNEDHCRFFWECVSGTAVCRFCEKGLWWDRERYVCDFPSAVRNCPTQQN